MSTVPYDSVFFDHHEEGSRQSARETLPLVWRFIKPTSVVDVGCGIGSWLAEFQAAGVHDYIGVDGDYVDRAKLLIEPEKFLSRDLTKPLRLERVFDLAVSLEVAEHLPAEAADTFVESLVRLAPVVLFSAAIPWQGGTHHINLQWPEYWQERFRDHDYVVVDCLREPLWRNPKVKPWYAQNMMFYIRRAKLGNYPALTKIFADRGEKSPLARVHPEHYLDLCSAFMKKVMTSQCLAMGTALGLRVFNLLCFPDWDRPRDQIASQLRTVFEALNAHPDKQRIALVVHVAKKHQPGAGELLGELAYGTFFPGGVKHADAPEVVGISEPFGNEQWEVLLSCVQLRLELAHEDARTIESTGASRITPLPLAAIEQKDRFIRQ